MKFYAQSNICKEDSSVDIATSQRTGQSWILVWILEGAGNLSLLLSAETVTGIHTACILGAHSLRLKQPKPEADHSPSSKRRVWKVMRLVTLHVCSGLDPYVSFAILLPQMQSLRKGGAILPLAICLFMTWCLIKHREILLSTLLFHFYQNTKININIPMQLYNYFNKFSTL
jgi:hypothetical protein